MNGLKILAAEYGASLAMQTYVAIKPGYLPWPGFVFRTSLAFSVLAVLEMLAPGMGALIGAGMMITLFIKNPQGWTNPSTTTYGDSGDVQSIPPGVAASAILKFQTGSGTTSGGAQPSSFIIGNGSTGTGAGTGGSGTGSGIQTV
jgi:hypothetical protein